MGDLTENAPDLCDKLLSVEPGGECILYFDSLGGSPYSAIALASLILLRGLKATGIVAGECSSAALWPLAACSRRLVTPLSVLLFHPMKWQSEENVGLGEAAEWARHFAPTRNRHGPPAGRSVPLSVGNDSVLGAGEPLRDRHGAGRGGLGRNGRTQAAEVPAIARIVDCDC